MAETDATFVIGCDCGFEVRGSTDRVTDAVACPRRSQHGGHSEQVLARPGPPDERPATCGFPTGPPKARSRPRCSCSASRRALLGSLGPCGPLLTPRGLVEEDPMERSSLGLDQPHGPPMLVHSTSWHRDRSTVLLSFVVALRDGPVLNQAGVPNHHAKRPRHLLTAAASSVLATQVIEHGLRLLRGSRAWSRPAPPPHSGGRCSGIRARAVPSSRHERRIAATSRRPTTFIALRHAVSVCGWACVDSVGDSMQRLRSAGWWCSWRSRLGSPPITALPWPRRFGMRRTIPCCSECSAALPPVAWIAGSLLAVSYAAESFAIAVALAALTRWNSPSHGSPGLTS